MINDIMVYRDASIIYSFGKAIFDSYINVVAIVKDYLGMCDLQNLSLPHTFSLENKGHKSAAFTVSPLNLL